MNSNLESLVEQSLAAFSNRLGVAPQHCSIQPYSADIFSQFIEQNSLEKSAFAVYAPESHTIYINTESSTLFSDLIHEFVHATITEYSTSELPFDFEESAALYFEQQLAPDQFNQKSYSSTLQNILRSTNQFVNKHTELALIGELGLPKHYSVEDAKKLLYSYVPNAQLAMLYGSNLPTSDIDFFVVAQGENGQFVNSYLDISFVNPDTFNQYMQQYDIACTDPIISGEFLYGDRSMYQQSQHLLSQRKPPSSAAHHNRERAFMLLEELPHLNERDSKIAQSYVTSYLLHADLLQRDIAVLTRDELSKVTSSRAG